jgi:hypothetical protein
MRGRRRLRKKKYLRGIPKGTRKRKLAIIEFGFDDPYYARRKRKLFSLFMRNFEKFGAAFKAAALATQRFSIALRGVKATKGFSGIVRGPTLIKAHRGERIKIRTVGGKESKS